MRRPSRRRSPVHPRDTRASRESCGVFFSFPGRKTLARAGVVFRRWRRDWWRGDRGLRARPRRLRSRHSGFIFRGLSRPPPLLRREVPPAPFRPRSGRWWRGDGGREDFPQLLRDVLRCLGGRTGKARGASGTRRGLTPRRDRVACAPSTTVGRSSVSDADATRDVRGDAGASRGPADLTRGNRLRALGLF